MDTMKLLSPKNLILVTAAGLVSAGCHTDMWVQPRQLPLTESTFYPNKMSTRPPVEGTVARGFLRDDVELYKGYTAEGKVVERIPESAIAQFAKAGDSREKTVMTMLKRGRERFDIYCSHCHGRLGDGKGMIAQRGFALKRPPANYHDPRLLAMPDGHFFDAMTNGYGTMFPQASRVEAVDRWAIVAYIRAMQLSGSAPVSEVPADQVGSIKPAAEVKK